MTKLHNTTKVVSKSYYTIQEGKIGGKAFDEEVQATGFYNH